MKHIRFLERVRSVITRAMYRDTALLYGCKFIEPGARVFSESGKFVVERCDFSENKGDSPMLTLLTPGDYVE